MIKKLCDEHLNELFEICMEIFKKESWNILQLKNAIKNNFCIGYFQDKKLVSFLIAENLIDDYNILLIATKKDFRNKGFASNLLNALEEECRKCEIEKIWLEVRASNLPAKKFYFGQKFEEIFVRKKYYKDGEDAIILEKIL